jgi:2-polyprenyl-6-methoxyphenol hydroxylase-like FAD-dependent oxidoreductase
MSEVTVIGSGLVARWSALALSRLGLRTALSRAAWQHASADIRSYAITEANAQWLRELSVWDEASACRVDAMQVQGFAAGADAPLSLRDAQAWIVPAAALSELALAALKASTVAPLDAEPERNCTSKVSIHTKPDLELDPACLLVLAEGGGREVLASRLGVPVESFGYPASAVAAVVATEQPHAHTARQWMREPSEVLALLPLVGTAQSPTGWAWCGRCRTMLPNPLPRSTTLPGAPSWERARSWPLAPCFRAQRARFGHSKFRVRCSSAGRAGSPLATPRTRCTPWLGWGST